MSESSNIEVVFGQFGPTIKVNEIKRMLNPQNDQDISERSQLASFLKLNDSIPQDFIVRYVKACEQMSYITLSSACDSIHHKLIATLASAKRCFSYGEYLACIELCALHAEMLSNFLCICHEECLKSQSVINQLSKDAKAAIKKYIKNANFYDKLNQSHRIEWMASAGVTNEPDKQVLDKIHRSRIEYFHHWDQSHEDIEVTALESLGSISQVAASHLELFNNEANIKKIRAYMHM